MLINGHHSLQSSLPGLLLILIYIFFISYIFKVSRFINMYVLLTLHTPFMIYSLYKWFIDNGKEKTFKYLEFSGFRKNI